LQGAKRIADLFCGTGAFALRLARTARVCAYDNDSAAIAAMQEAARSAEGLRLEKGEARDLFRQPLTADELGAFDSVVFDPPRAGAEAQARELAKSTVRRVVAVSCNAQSFARDAKLLLGGGYKPGPTAVTPIDQFRFSPHVEIVATFLRARETKPKRALLSR
jgi:23S rRNA (uracil1939-C5)-methyltransferase